MRPPGSHARPTTLQKSPGPRAAATLPSRRPPHLLGPVGASRASAFPSPRTLRTDGELRSDRVRMPRMPRRPQPWRPPQAATQRTRPPSYPATSHHLAPRHRRSLGRVLSTSIHRRGRKRCCRRSSPTWRQSTWCWMNSAGASSEAAADLGNPGRSVARNASANDRRHRAQGGAARCARTRPQDVRRTAHRWP